MIITREVLENFNACSEMKERFCKDHPCGLDISPLWGTDQDAQMFWSVVFSSMWKYQVGWAIGNGLLPARIRANLSGANLSRAILYRANLSGADLIGANLSRADLIGANLSGADLSGIRYNKYTAWPIGFKVTE